MHNHEPQNYECPFCKLIRGKDDEINTREHIIYQDEKTLAYVAPKWWKNNHGSVLVVPKQHTENIFSISEELNSAVYETVRKIAIAIRETYNCDGISTRQHNEPAGNQSVWHIHVHVLPRYEKDELYQNHDNKAWGSNDERMEYVKKLKQYFEKI